MYNEGHSVVSVDPVYQFSSDEIREQIDRTYPTVASLYAKNSRTLGHYAASEDVKGYSAAMARVARNLAAVLCAPHVPGEEATACTPSAIRSVSSFASCRTTREGDRSRGD